MTIEDRSGGKLALVDDFSEWTAGEVQPGARTTWVEWKNVVLGAGYYEVVLVTHNCIARDRIEVTGDARRR